MTILKSSRRLADFLATKEEDNTDDLYDRDDYYQHETEPFTTSTGGTLQAMGIEYIVYKEDRQIPLRVDLTVDTVVDASINLCCKGAS